MDSEAFWAGFFLGVFAILILLMAVGADAKTVKEEFRKEAIEHKAAHWTIDPTTGDKQFTWK